ncbi:MAG: hypothetical protein JWL94_1928, partial [Microbacteriaceae bacterium]|nr:hypothetical protein [Microbacteriaceae bacterium]
MTEQLASPVEIKERKPARDWHRPYAIRLAVTDFLVLVWVVFGVQ